MGAQGLNPQVLRLEDFQPAVDACLGEWTQRNKTTRLWNRDAGLWTGHDEARWLGWLDIASQQLADLESLDRLQRDVKNSRFHDVVVLGMGGSSLAPDVLSRTFGRRPDFPQLRILDSTVPDQIATLESQLDLSKTLFVVASKSGTTAEPIAFESYFFDKVGDGSQFMAVTDPGTALEEMARSKGYGNVYPGEPTIGGRFSALSNFGMVPAAAMGLDVRRFLERAHEMANACGADVLPEDNPGVVLGVALATLARAGRDKLSLVAAPELSSLGAWIEQLVAESTGKGGQGILPVDGETAGIPDVYGDDRVFVQLDRDDSDPPAFTAGHPLIHIRVATPENLAQEFFRWEMATAVAGAVLGLNPFDQPDVEASKVKTRALATRYEETGELHDDGDEDDTFPSDEAIRTHLDLLEPGDYFAIHAYLEMSPGASPAATGDPRAGARSEAGRDHARLRASVPALHRTAPQRRFQPRGVFAAHRGQRLRPPHPGPALELRPAEPLPGRWRFRGSGRARTACPEGPSGAGRYTWPRAFAHFGLTLSPARDYYISDLRGPILYVLNSTVFTR